MSPSVPPLLLLLSTSLPDSSSRPSRRFHFPHRTRASACPACRDTGRSPCLCMMANRCKCVCPADVKQVFSRTRAAKLQRPVFHPLFSSKCLQLLYKYFSSGENECSLPQPRLCVLPTKCFLPPPSLPARRFCSDLLHRRLFLLLCSAPCFFSRFCLSFYVTQLSLFIAGIS